MASLEELKKERLKKLHTLEEKGMEPYPVYSEKGFSNATALKDFSKLSKRKKPLYLAGRVRSIRGQGKILFATFDDGTASFQAVLKKDEMDKALFEDFASFVDGGDFVSFGGSLFTTKRKEKSILVSDWKMLAKSLRPLPDKWHGLQDVEERFRKRYLDTLLNSDIKERFIMRSRIITEIRKILDNDEYLEVETPILQHHAGGASALPFKTHHNALDIDLFLRISPELYLKELLVGGFNKVYEIGRNFRNEGIDVTHNPEFTMLEFYESYSDAEKQMAFVETMLKKLTKSVLGKQSFLYDGKKIDFSKKFQIVSYFDLLKRYALVTDPAQATHNELLVKANQLGIDTQKGVSKDTLLDLIYKKSCRPKLEKPTFVVDYPAHTLPLAKKKDDTTVDAFQLVVAGVELVKGFSELNDPLEQKKRFEKQEENKAEGDKEAQTTDDAYLEAMEYGMPPAGGVGIGIDRLVMLLTDTKNIREVILFPTLRPKQ